MNKTLTDRKIKDVKNDICTLRESIDSFYEMIDYMDANREYFDHDYSAWASNTKKLYICDAALAGEVLGREGWTKHLSGSRIDWERKHENFTLVLQSAEKSPFDGVPVQTNEFPLLLKDE